MTTGKAQNVGGSQTCVEVKRSTYESLQEYPLDKVTEAQQAFLKIHVFHVFLT